MSLFRCFVFVLAAISPIVASGQSPEYELPRISLHDNRLAAGHLENGVLRLSLWAGVGTWKPEGEKSRAFRVEAFGEEGQPLAIPSPLIRVKSGTEVHASVRNTLEAPLRIHGLCTRAEECDPFIVPPEVARDVRFKLDQPGTFHYWATTSSSSIPERFGADSQLGGAIVVDPPDGDAADRVFVMGMIDDSSSGSVREVTVINGRSWPDTERLQYVVGDTARWRLVNLTGTAHAMHLHGFYFQIGSVGNGLRNTRYAEYDRRLAVTEFIPPAGTMTLAWVPERAGNWLFHCHMLVHMMPPEGHHNGTANPHLSDASAAGMAGLVLGVTVSGDDRRQLTSEKDERRTLKLIIQPDDRHGETPSYKVDIETGANAAPRLGEEVVPGPVMVLTRGEPVAVEVSNRLNEPTAIHWHGIELESYDDGVPGFGGMAGSVTPPVNPGESFTARFTPSRAGTFIYHTHWHNAAQLAAGIYGPLIVLEPGQTYDPITDHVVVFGLDGAYKNQPDEPLVVNGRVKPSPLELKSGVPNRIRLINITANNVGLVVQLLSGFDPVQWTPVGKDGSETPQKQRVSRPARQIVTVGETYDFELTPVSTTGAGRHWMELRRGTGELLFQWPVVLK